MHDDLTDFLFSELVEDSPELKKSIYDTVRTHLEQCLKAQYWPAHVHYCTACGSPLRVRGRNANACLNCDYRGGK